MPDLQSVSETESEGESSDNDTDSEWDWTADIIAALEEGFSNPGNSPPVVDPVENFINEFLQLDCVEHSEKNIPLPGVENFACSWSLRDAKAIAADSSPLYSWADDAKEVFGYPTTDYSTFVLHKTVTHGWYPNSIGDFYSYAVEFALNHNALYPSDEHHWGATMSHHFGVFKLNKDMYTISNFESEHGRLTMPASLLKTPGFHIGAWYAKQHCRLLGFDFNSKLWNNKCREISDALRTGLHFVLSHGVSAYPKEWDDIKPKYSPYNCFRIDRMVDDDGTDYLSVVDCELKICVFIDLDCVKNPYFDTVNWWSKNVKKALHEWNDKQL
ncbi:hypothetical protein ARMGADRAFT_1071044 [Armillaria gallica]|uniref:Uncharacterized protein n=1 Tax=Armillaria gallica TaxID=47427 RepID=A0A2H3EWC9_ARMGA|nr:hypothetical protein ARMGADRAFT_1071044 [Armillaria gallica]